MFVFSLLFVLFKLIPAQTEIEWHWLITSAKWTGNGRTAPWARGIKLGGGGGCPILWEQYNNPHPCHGMKRVSFHDIGRGLLNCSCDIWMAVSNGNLQCNGAFLHWVLRLQSQNSPESIEGYSDHLWRLVHIVIIYYESQYLVGDGMG